MRTFWARSCPSPASRQGLAHLKPSSYFFPLAPTKWGRGQGEGVSQHIRRRRLRVETPLTLPSPPARAGGEGKIWHVATPEQTCECVSARVEFPDLFTPVPGLSSSCCLALGAGGDRP